MLRDRSIWSFDPTIFWLILFRRYPMLPGSCTIPPTDLKKSLVETDKPNIFSFHPYKFPLKHLIIITDHFIKLIPGKKVVSVPTRKGSGIVTLFFQEFLIRLTYRNICTQYKQGGITYEAGIQLLYWCYGWRQTPGRVYPPGHTFSRISALRQILTYSYILWMFLGLFFR